MTPDERRFGVGGGGSRCDDMGPALRVRRRIASIVALARPSCQAAILVPWKEERLTLFYVVI